MLKEKEIAAVSKSVNMGLTNISFSQFKTLFCLPLKPNIPRLTGLQK
jgi:hypothetical protein